MSTPTVTPYSAKVDLKLIVGDQTYDLGQVGPELVIFRDPVSLPPCDAVLIMTIDGHEQRSNIRLLDGASPDNRITRTKILSH